MLAMVVAVRKQFLQSQKQRKPSVVVIFPYEIKLLVRDIDTDRKLISIDIYKPWVKTAERLIKSMEDNGCRLILTKETLFFKTFTNHNLRVPRV